jgi:tetratricopeptide (TPR) repeat protein
MKSSHGADVEDKHAVVSEFLASDTQKIYMVIGSDPSALCDFVDESCAIAASREENRVFRYEIWEGEHSRHFLFRWLWDTVSGAAYCGSGKWSDISQSAPQLIQQLHLLVEKDIRPLEIRFMEAIRFIAAHLAPGERIVLYFAPKTALQDKVLVDFFQAVLRVIPLHVKMLIAQGTEDVLAGKADFCPSNRLILTAADEKAGKRIPERYLAFLESGSMSGRVLRILAHQVHPVELELLASITGESESSLSEILRSPEMKELVEPVSDNAFRLRCPQALPAETVHNGQREGQDSLDRQALDYYRTRLSQESPHYMDVLCHSVCLHRIEDPQIMYRHVQDTCMRKLRMGGGDVCELEISRALSFLGEEQTHMKAELLVRLGEVREARQRNQEAMEALDPAIEILRSLGSLEDLQFALEIKGRAAFAIRETDTSKTALEESLRTARQMGRDDLAADILSQIGYLHFSLRQLTEAEARYRESLELYWKLAEADEAKGRKGAASQWSNLGHTSYAKGDLAAAEAHHRKALEMFESLGEAQASANQWGYLGHTFFAAHSYEKAIQAYERAAETEEKLGKPEKAAQRYANVGHSMYAQRKADLARRSFQKALDTYAQLGNLEGKAAQLSNLGLVEGDQGEYEPAVDYFNQAALLYRELGDAIGETAQIVRVGHVRRAQQHYDDAIQQYESALRRYRDMSYPMGEGDTLVEMGQLHVEKKDWQKARGCFEDAKALFAKLSHREKEALCLMLMANADKGRGEAEAAMSAMQQAMELYKQEDNLLGVANVVSQMGLLHYEQQHFEDAERLYQESLAAFRKKQDVEGEANLLSNLGTLYYQTDKLGKAREHYEKALSLLREMNHPAGIAGLLINFSFISEKEGKLDEARAQLEEAKEIYQHLHVSDQSGAIDRRIATLEDKARKSLEQMRAELSQGRFKSDSPRSGASGKVGRNDPCPCGSGKKYKKCCG